MHNDYRIHAEHRTFWLLTKGNLAAKGEAPTDGEALMIVRDEVERIERVVHNTETFIKTMRRLLTTDNGNSPIWAMHEALKNLDDARVFEAVDKSMAKDR